MDMYVYVMGRALRAIRKRKRIRQVELANECGYSQSTISRMEDLYSDLSLSYVRRLCKVFNIDFIQLHELCVTCCENVKPLNLPDADSLVSEFAKKIMVDELVEAHVKILLTAKN